MAMIRLRAILCAALLLAGCVLGLAACEGGARQERSPLPKKDGTTAPADGAVPDSLVPGQPLPPYVPPAEYGEKDPDVAV
ncbi:MAG: hypothetical protein LW884_05060 [Bacteroidetes bacterium]|jgi:ABC-type oligopeptide transport system substrate-binding subunit|nr:hypothetical protein [Bacteroidota bacterium]